MASAYTLERLSTMPRTTASARAEIVFASLRNGSRRLRLAQLSQARKSAQARGWSLVTAARA